MFSPIRVSMSQHLLLLWRGLFCAVGLSTALLVSIGCQQGASTHSADSSVTVPQDPGVLRVGISATYPPLAFDQEGQRKGLEVDLAQELAQALGRKAQFVPTFWPNLIADLRKKRFDIIMSGMSITPERKRQVAFTEPYLLIGQQALIRQADRATLGTQQAIAATQRRVGVEMASTGEEWVTQRLPTAQRFSRPTLQRAVEELRQGSVDVVIHDSPAIQWLARQYQDDGLMAVPGLLTQESLAWALRQDDRDLLKSVNAILAEWKNTGKLQAIIDRWMSEPQ